MINYAGDISHLARKSTSLQLSAVQFSTLQVSTPQVSSPLRCTAAPVPGQVTSLYGQLSMQTTQHICNAVHGQLSMQTSQRNCNAVRGQLSMCVASSSCSQLSIG